MTPLLLLAEVAEKSPWTGFLGRMHPGVVHFPIALLAVAALFEVFQILKKRPEPAPGTLPMVVLAMLAAVAASFFGFMLADYESTEGPKLDLHKWLGIASTVVSIVAALCAWGARRSTAALGGLRLCLI